MAKKISDLTAISGGVFSDNDLFEVSVDTGGGSYVSRKILGSEVKTTIGGANIGNSDLTISTSGARKLILGGALTSDYFVIRNNTDSADYFKVRGDGGTIMSDQVGVGITPNGNQSFYAYTNSRIYAGSFLTQASNGTALSAQASLNGNCTAIKVTNTTAGGSGTRHGIVFDVRNGINNYAIKIDNGDYKISHTGNHKMILGGALSTDSFVIRNSADSADYFKVQGDGQVYIYGRGNVSSNVGIGRVFSASTTGGQNIAIGEDALITVTTGNNNTAIGSQALRYTVGSRNIAIGNTAGLGISSGSDNITLGTSAGSQIGTSGNNIAMGYWALKGACGSSNIAIGYTSMQSGTGGVNTLVGTQSGFNLTTGNYNTGFGYLALYGVTSGSNNLQVRAGNNTSATGITSGSNNVLIGIVNGLSNPSNNIVINDGQGNRLIRKDANGNQILGDESALATTATNGFTYIPSGAGTPTGTPTSVTGKVPMYYDDTNQILYIYSGGVWNAH